MRRAGHALYAIGALLLIAAVVVFVRRPTNAVSTRRPYVGTQPTATAPPLSSPATTSVASTPAGTGSVQDGNTPPRITAPETATVKWGRYSAVKGISVADAESREGDTFGVLLSAPEGKVKLGTTAGLRLTAENGSSWLPIEGRIDDVNAALATLTYAAQKFRGSHTLLIVATDNGHRNRYQSLATQFTMHISVKR